MNHLDLREPSPKAHSRFVHLSTSPRSSTTDQQPRSSKLLPPDLATRRRPNRLKRPNIRLGHRNQCLPPVFLQLLATSAILFLLLSVLPQPLAPAEGQPVPFFPLFHDIARVPRQRQRLRLGIGAICAPSLVVRSPGQELPQDLHFFSFRNLSPLGLYRCARSKHL